MSSVHCICLNSFLVDRSPCGTYDVILRIDPTPRVQTLGVCFLCRAQRHPTNTVTLRLRDFLLNITTFSSNAKVLVECLSVETLIFPSSHVRIDALSAHLRPLRLR